MCRGGAASIDLKADEPGLLAWAREEQLPLTFYTAEALRQAEGDFSPSEFVKTVTGVDNVCERRRFWLPGEAGCASESRRPTGLPWPLRRKK